MQGKYTQAMLEEQYPRNEYSNLYESDINKYVLSYMDVFLNPSLLKTRGAKWIVDNIISADMELKFEEILMGTLITINSKVCRAYETSGNIPFRNRWVLSGIVDDVQNKYENTLIALRKAIDTGSIEQVLGLYDNVKAYPFTCA